MYNKYEEACTLYFSAFCMCTVAGNQMLFRCF